ncbi:hypothetical protein PS623_04565 [Pseudomonas fluorescens]|uniref:hypothetical protein n=1 Tax=Pseudomonas fluorescens TaxID=294 RepID=UPI0012514815|nr:hypothetical protein [Pseudomonas fluorescens]VVN26588.1 hypothetical protein PS623_04565 [Pseudomonas fluorescens]
MATMKPHQFAAVLDRATEAEREALDGAHWRYISLIGLVHDALPAEVVATDKEAYQHFIKRCEEGRPVFSDADCIAFMTAITGLSHEFCAAWKDHDFYELHGETFEEMAAREKASSVGLI